MQRGKCVAHTVRHPGFVRLLTVRIRLLRRGVVHGLRVWRGVGARSSARRAQAATRLLGSPGLPTGNARLAQPRSARSHGCAGQTAAGRPLRRHPGAHWTRCRHPPARWACTSLLQCRSRSCWAAPPSSRCARCRGRCCTWRARCRGTPASPSQRRRRFVSVDRGNENAARRSYEPHARSRTI